MTKQLDASQPFAPFARFAPPIRGQDALRQAITDATRLRETEAVPPLLEAATLPPAIGEAATATATRLVERLRAKPVKNGVQALVQEYALSSEEGVALMCLAEALLRIPDARTRDALIRDKIAGGNWAGHLGEGQSLFVNAATWGLIVTGRLTATVDDRGLGNTLHRLVAQMGEPVIRRAVDAAMRMMGEQFVTGEDIAEALKRSRRMEAKGFTYSYDMLGEAAVTAKDAERYFADYEKAIHAIGGSASGAGVIEGPGISIKLSALHPRYERAQARRVMAELLPRVKALAVLAKTYDIGLNIDAEEADRLELSLDILEALAEDNDLAGWQGLGFVVQAYGKRSPLVIDWIIHLARRTGRRIMLRLVKGAYWDTEIKRAQVDGLPDFTVFTRKVYTDVCYIACARKLLAAPDAVFPQFATHNARTLAAIYHLAGPDFEKGDYEFQCLHGMGEALYEEVVGGDKLARPCRIYAPVGTHETLLAYLVRRLLENGANSSFVNRIADPAVPVAELVADPAEKVAAMAIPGERHTQIALPADIYGARRNAAGLDLADENVLASLGQALRASANRQWAARSEIGDGETHAVRNPADHRDIVGEVIEAGPETVRAALERAAGAAPGWARVPVEDRAQRLELAADAMQAAMPGLIGLLMREAGKSAANAIAEIREAVDFLRYYAMQARENGGGEPLGPVVCISPWNFPLAIFTGQIAAALVAGNAVLAKPAEETPLIAAEAVRLLHSAGIPQSVLQLVPGDGSVGAALVGAKEVGGVMFTGSTEVARLIQAQLAERLSDNGKPIPLIAETGGQNAMIVDSSSLAEQVVRDVVASAFDSAGQRCSALRVLCLQEDIADHTLQMLKGAMRELSVGNPDRLSVDVGPVITQEAEETITRYVEEMRGSGRVLEQLAAKAETQEGTFVLPTLIEIDSLADLGREVFGPVLHVLRFRARDVDALIRDINGLGYGLTFGLHTRLDTMIAKVRREVSVGNIYVNRNMIGAVVGVQPFGGHGLSGTGPKAGGPLYLTRLGRNPVSREGAEGNARAADDYLAWLEGRGEGLLAASLRRLAGSSRLGWQVELPGPVGERDIYELGPRGWVALCATTPEGLWTQLAAAIATGNKALVGSKDAKAEWLDGLPAELAGRIEWSEDPLEDPRISAALVEGGSEVLLDAQAKLAARPGIIVQIQAAGKDCPPVLDWLFSERSVSIDTTAAGGNASLMAVS